MAEYIKREVVLNRLETVKKRITPIEENRDLFYHDSGINGAVTGAMLEVKKIPAADVVEIVRCMYCKRSEKRNGNRYCTYWQDTVDPMHYCGKGDRREPL